MEVYYDTFAFIYTSECLVVFNVSVTELSGRNAFFINQSPWPLLKLNICPAFALVVVVFIPYPLDYPIHFLKMCFLAHLECNSQNNLRSYVFQYIILLLVQIAFLFLLQDIKQKVLCFYSKGFNTNAVESFLFKEKYVSRMQSQSDLFSLERRWQQNFFSIGL